MDVSRFAGWHDTDLLRDMTVTSSGFSTYTHSNLVDFKANNGWRTQTSSGSGAFAAKVDMAASQDINYVWVLPGFENDSTTYLNEYRIGISDTGTEDSFTVVASGTTTSGSLEPKIHFIGNEEARYVKLYVDSNHGSPSYTHVGKISAFYEPDWSMFGHRNTNISNGGTYAQLVQDIDFTPHDYISCTNCAYVPPLLMFVFTYAQLVQDIDFTPHDYIFTDVRAFMSDSFQIGSLDVMVDSDVLKSYDWDNTGLTWLDSNEDNFWTRL